MTRKERWDALALALGHTNASCASIKAVGFVLMQTEGIDFNYQRFVNLARSTRPQKEVNQ